MTTSGSVARANPVDVHVGLVIRQRRKALGRSQEALAEAIGVSFQQVQKYERGANRVSASMLWEIARALRCKVADFFSGLADQHDACAAGDPEGFGHIGRTFLASNGGLELARVYLTMAPAHRRALLAAGRALASTEAEGRAWRSASAARADQSAR